MLGAGMAESWFCGGEARRVRSLVRGFFSETCVSAEVYGSSVTILRRYLRILIFVPPVYGGLRDSGVGVDGSVAR